jgi:deoxyribonuclease V
MRYIAGLDAAYMKKHPVIIGAAVVLDIPALNLVEESVCSSLCRFPYIPGKLFQREGEALLKAFQGLKTKVDAVIVDGNGILHPDQRGLATEIGRRLNLPTIGCAKSLLLGSHAPVDKKAGKYSYIYYNKKILGACLRTRDNTKPVYVSTGFKISLDRAMEIILTVSRFRIPEPVRKAHKLAGEYKNSKLNAGAGYSSAALKP